MGALYGGGKFIADPSGNSLQITVHLLRHSPFKDFLVPGIILFVANGVFSLLTLVLLLINNSNYPKAITIQGCILLGWIIIQIALLCSFNALHFTLGSTGIVLIVNGGLLWRFRN